MTDTISDSSVDPSEREFGPSGISLSPYRFPTGWFIVGFASELAPGAVKRAHYFGEEMVLFRTQSGEVHVLDAYCQHLGANMGVGGTVEGENIVCPCRVWPWPTVRRSRGTPSCGSSACLPNARLRVRRASTCRGSARGRDAESQGGSCLCA